MKKVANPEPQALSIQMTITSIWDELSALHAGIYDLADKCEPVLSPPPPSPIEAEAAQDLTGLCSLHVTLEAIRANLKGAVEEARKLYGRVQL